MAGSEAYSVKLVLVVPCSTCGEARSAPASGLCSTCNGLLPADLVATVREAVRQRRQAFKGRLNRLEQRMREVTGGLPTFSTRGQPLSENDHLNQVLRPALNNLKSRHESVVRLLKNGTWDPGEADCAAAFNGLVGTLEAGLTHVAALRDTMPPIEWRAVHRELARAANEQVRGQISITLTIIAPDYDAALMLQDAGNRSFAAGARHAERVGKLIDLARRMPKDGPFQADGSLDFAALAWASVGQGSTSIANGAELVRQAFANVPGVSTLTNEYAVTLLPLLAQGASVVDYGTLIERTRLLRAVLDTADAAATWVSDPALLVCRVQRALERITAEAERLGREWRYGLPRKHVMKSMTEVYRELVEGALRDIGGAILIAGRASRNEANSTYELAVADGIKAGEIISDLDRIGAPCGGAVDMLYRNASAHAGIQVTDTGVIVTKRVIENERALPDIPTPLSDAEFAEEMVALHEILLALQLTVLPWLWNHPDRNIAEAFRSTPVSVEQRDRTIALLGGMAGLRDISVSTDGSQVSVAGELHSDNSDRREIGIISLAPAAFGPTPEVTTVTLHIGDLNPVSFVRSEFIGSEVEDPTHGLIMLGLTSAKWLVESGMSWTARDEATYVTFSLTQLHIDCLRLAGSAPHSTENIDQAVESVRLVRLRLDQILVSQHRSTLTRQAVEQLDIISTSLKGLADSRRGLRSVAEGQQLAQKAAATLDPIYHIQEKVRAIRDANPVE